MSTYQVEYKASTKTAYVQYSGDARPAGTSHVGTFVLTKTAGDYGIVEPTVIYQKVRELLESELGIINMQFITINLDEIYVALTAIAISPGTVTKAVGETQQLSITPTPNDASNTTVTWSSSNTAKATVNSSGLVTAVATGTATITATSQDGGLTATRLVTVS